MSKVYKLKSKILVYQGMSAWRFLVLPVAAGKEIKETNGKSAKGWGSLPVSVSIGHTTWQTSIFPDKKAGTYLLPLKAQIRKKEDIADDDVVSFTLTIR